MLLANIPGKFAIPFASSAGAGFIRSIPQTPTGTPGQASLQQGFPPENFNPVAAGGVPPFGQDFNGILNQSTAWNQWQAAGVAVPPYDATFQTAVGGYPNTALVSSLASANLIYMSIVDSNLTNPDAGGAGWIVFWRQLVQNTTLYVNTATGSDFNNGLTLATAKKTIGAALLTAWTFGPSTQGFGITIMVATGTYNESIVTPQSVGPTITIDGGVAANVLVNSGSTGPCFMVLGPNFMTVQNVSVESAGTILNGFTANQGATMITNNTISQSLSGYIFGTGSGGNIVPGTHTVSGSAKGLFFAQTGGSLTPPNSTNYTFSSAVSFSDATASAINCGIINMPINNPVTFTNPGNVTGKRYDSQNNGVVFQVGLGASFFPGSAAGTTANGGQAVT